jgi:DNA-binding PadR family transcriptional regulator
MGIKDYSQEEVSTVATGAVGNEACLINITECGKIERRRQLELWRAIFRHTMGLLTALAELSTGQKIKF